jgi:hypothetical protein
MRVLLTHRPEGAYAYISDGWLNAFRSVGHQAERWDGTPEMWSAFKPDLYMGCSAHKQPIPAKRDNCRVAIHVNPFGPVHIPGIDEELQNIQWTVAQRPDVVFGYGHATDIQFWSYWPLKLGIQWIPMATAVDITLFNSKPQPKHYDLVYVGGRWPYKALRLDPWLLRMLSQSGMSYKLYGFGEWPGVKCRPVIPHEQVPMVLAAARVGPCVNEPHIAQYGFDLAERAFKVAAVGTVVVHDKIPGLERFLPNAIVADTPEHFQNLCLHYSKAPQSVLDEVATRQRRDVLSGQTYHHRLAGLLSALGFNSAAAEMQTYIKALTDGAA